MKKDIKERWVAKLRDPNIKQTQGVLKKQIGDNEFAYCCLGVLCEVAVEDGILPPSRLADKENDVVRQEIVYDGKDHSSNTYAEGSVLPYNVSVWAGLGGENNPFVPDPSESGLSTSLAEANDNGYSFLDIANLIERNIPDA